MENIFIIGGASYNSVITLDEFPVAIPQTIHNCHFKETIGNTGAGKALTLSKLGFNTTFHSLIGKDSFGEKVTSFLQEPNLNFISDIDPKGTERHLNIMNGLGERISIFMNPSSDTPEIDYSKFEKEVKNAIYIVVNIANYCRNILPICKQLNKEIWTDLHDYDGKNEYHQDFIAAADYIFLSSDNLPNYKPFMLQQIANGKKLVVCTHGKGGATAYTKEGGWIETSIIDAYKMTNANGAGDSFFSGFLYGFSKGYDTKKCMQFGTITSGLCIESELIANNKLSKTIVEREFLKYYVK
ncbi:carbohydrate kinase family protein [Lutibacter flavus]|uniref:Sugar or nucleoside kinase, ribokinase family n=1 Tax=Lutibacter flavus TaxID=691689 RepID=A0A238VMY2_9FLAO|nr:carbohydrate kinase family protein [Lutibacter flavus]SNR35524.1 Sugar or nucleoside kinase, ribokinase family [Lutibacter flavus]